MSKKISESKTLLKQWNYKRNTGLSPEKLAQGSNKKVWWVCGKGHEWETDVWHRTRPKKPTGCPYCSGRYACPDNNLAVSNPSLAKQWHPTKNGDLSPSMMTPYSNKKAWWKCEKGHSWEASINNRKSRGCPYCSGKKICSDNNLAFLNPAVANQWHPTKNSDLSPDMFTPGSSKKVWWVCDKGHEWQAQIASRKTCGCPYCSGQKTGSDNNLAVLNPAVAKQWHPTKNSDLVPSMLVPGSSKKVWWMCDKGHEWESIIVNRTKAKNPSGCPKCTKQSSEPEIRILTELMSIFDGVISRYKIRSLELDIYIPTFKIGIEYDGSYYHKNKESQDKKKNKAIEKEGMKLIRVRHHPLKPISLLDIVHVKERLTKAILNELMSTLKLLVDQSHSKKINDYLKKNGFVNQYLFQKYMSYFPDPFPENSLENLFPKLCKEWNYEKNKPLLPSNFSHGSGKKVWWVCDKGHEWEAVIYSRRKHGCPYCAGQRATDKNNLAVLNPAVAKQWHPTKNSDLSPDMVTPGSDKKVWWVCDKGHEWEAVIAYRKTNKCPYCSSLAFLNLAVAKQWHPTRNSDLSPDMVTPGSSKKVWWVCDKGHEWKTTIGHRTDPKQPTGCPYCAGRKS
jgi:hypothetical protein